MHAAVILWLGTYVIHATKFLCHPFLEHKALIFIIILTNTCFTSMYDITIHHASGLHVMQQSIHKSFTCFITMCSQVVREITCQTQSSNNEITTL